MHNAWDKGKLEEVDGTTGKDRSNGWRLWDAPGLWQSSTCHERTLVIGCWSGHPSAHETVTLPADPRPTWRGRPSAEDSAFLDQLARDTWTYLSSGWATTNHLPWSWRPAALSGGDYANPAEIGLYALSWLAAYDLQRSWSPTWAQTEAEVNAVLDRLRAWQTGSQNEQPHGANAYQNGVFYQWYWISWNPPVVGEGADDHLVPSLDNAWLAVALVTV